MTTNIRVHQDPALEVDMVTNKLFTSLHNIDRSQDHPILRDVDTDDAEGYVKKLVEESQNNPNKRTYKFEDISSPICASLVDLFNQKEDDSIASLFDIECNKIAARLLRAEKKTALTHPGINPPKKGSLITTMEIIDSDLRITIAKIETEEFLDDINLKLLSGLPFNKKALKTAIINILPLDDEDEPHIDITITDSNSSIAKYWVDDFLEASEVVGDAKNTLLSFAEIEKVVSKSLKSKSPSDYTELRNNLVGYYKSQSSFHFDNMMEQVFGDYQIEVDGISIEDIKANVKKLAQTNKFDTHFNIISKEIKAKFKKTYKVTNEIEIRTNGYIQDLRHIIKSNTNTLGEKILEIKVEDDTIYKFFQFTNEDN